MIAVHAFHFQLQIPKTRPIAWVLSDNGDTTVNLAPFSYFNGVTSRPPTLSISIGHKRDRSKKDTWRNIEERGHFVVHIAGSDLAAQVSATAASLEFGESEAAANRLEVVPEAGWPLPRLKTVRIALLCERHQIIEIGNGPQGLVIGEIKSAWLADEIAISEGGSAIPGVDVGKLDPLARLGDDDYARLDQVFTVARPA
jgi:flavin reductase (DIM6/NTAB) family NADH-FMN oxidoreductase RutF